MQYRRFQVLLLLLLNGIFASNMLAQVKVEGHKSNHYQEANTVVPLPALKPSADKLPERGAKSATMEMPSPSPLAEARPAFAKPGNVPENNARVLTLPPAFRGYAIELIRSAKDLTPNTPVFLNLKEVFRVHEKDGKYSYLIVNLGSRDTAAAYYQQKIKPFNKSAQLVLFTQNGKMYLNP